MHLYKENMHSNHDFKLFLNQIEQFIEELLIPSEAVLANTHEIPAEIVKAMQKLGLFGLTIPTQYGGMGLTMSQEIEVVFQLGRAAPAFHSLIGANTGIGAQGIVLKGTEEQKNKYLPKLASGDMLAAFALTEENAGSDIASVETTACHSSKGWLINGKKRYISNATHANIFTVIARTNNQERKNLTAFLVDANTLGIKIAEPDKKMGHDGAPTAEVIFNNCLVPSNAILGEIGEGIDLVKQVLNRGRLRIAALSVGIAKRLIQDALCYAANRRQFGSRVVDFQLIQAMFADSQTESYAAECMVRETAKLLSSGIQSFTEAASCKLFATEMVGRVADRAVQILGGAGYMTAYPIERFYRDVRLFRIYEGTSQIQQLIIAKELIKQHLSTCVKHEH